MYLILFPHTNSLRCIDSILETGCGVPQLVVVPWESGGFQFVIVELSLFPVCFANVFMYQ